MVSLGRSSHGLLPGALGLPLVLHPLLPAPQVIAGAGLDVDFTLESPQGVLLVSESRKADGVHT